MRRIRLQILFSILIILITGISCNSYKPSTVISIRGNKFYINDIPTYNGRNWNGNSIEGLLFNSRMVQGIFDDINPETVDLWKYPDTDSWDPDRNTNEFVKSMEDWYRFGMLSFTLNLQGGSPTEYDHEGWVNSAFNEDGSLKKRDFTRLYRILKKADQLGMTPILGLFYFGQDDVLKDEEAVLAAVNNTINWLFESGFRNVLIEINNECDVEYDHEILMPDRVHELIDSVRSNTREGERFLVGTSFGGGSLPTRDVVKVSDFILLHGNGVDNPDDLRELIRKTKVMPSYNAQPVIINKDDHYGFDEEDYNLKAAVESYASWGYFDYRRQGDSIEDGFQSIPVDWSINSERKHAFFNRLHEITGGFQDE
jgi:hypothetical protein